MSNIAIITARGGSKRIPKKNIRDFLGKPIIAYSIEAAIHSCIFDEIMVSTDSEEIAEVAKAYGAKVPFFRSRETSGDFATSASAVIEVIKKYGESGAEFDYGCCLYPTAPFVEPKDLEEAYRRMVQSGADSSVSVVRYSFPPQRAYIIKDGCLRYAQPENYPRRSQDLEPMYHDTGQFYFFKPEGVLRENRLTLESNVPYEMDELRVQDIDSETDWVLAELKYSIMLKKNRNSGGG